MRNETRANITYTYPNAFAPLFGVEHYFKVQYISGSPANGMEKSITINGVTYKSVVISGVIYFYFDIKMATTTPFEPTTFTAVFEGETFTWKVYFGAGNMNWNRAFEALTFFRGQYDFSLFVPTDKKLYVKYYQEGLMQIKFGLLYNQSVARSGNIGLNGFDTPTYDDCIELRTLAGGTYGFLSKYKSTDSAYWNAPNTNAENRFGLDLRGGGFWNGTSYSQLKERSYVWHKMGYMGVVWDGSNAIGYSNEPTYYFSIRLVKPATAEQLLLANGTRVEDYTDYEGNRYVCRKIGSKIWMCENLITKFTADGAPITGGWRAYDNDESNVKTEYNEWKIASTEQSYTPLRLNLSKTTKIACIIYDDDDFPPHNNNPLWSAEKEVLPICSRTELTTDRATKEMFKWIDRAGYIHTYYFDVIAVSEAKGKVNETEKTREQLGDTVHYTNSLGGYKVTRTYLSIDETKQGALDISTLGSAMYLEINGIPTDTNLVGTIAVSSNTKGLQNITFSIVDELEDKNSVIW